MCSLLPGMFIFIGLSTHVLINIASMTGVQPV